MNGRGENTVLLVLEGIRLPEGTAMEEPGAGGSSPFKSIEGVEFLYG